MSHFKLALGAIALGASLSTMAVAPAPALANGAASTRNIIFGAAAAAAGTLIIINHNKKVHERYAEDERRQAQTQAEANQAQGAYESERQAYEHEAAIVSEMQREVSLQHSVIKRQNGQISSLTHSLLVAKAGGRARWTAFVQQATRVAAHPAARGRTQIAQSSPDASSYGWGNY